MRVALASIAFVVVSVACAGPGAVGESPTLGKPWASDQQGYGRASPTRIFNGGDPTGLVKNVHWTSWGDARALGVGTGWEPGKTVASGHWVRVKVVAWDLGRCRGSHAYRRIEWFRIGGRFNSRDAQDICTDLRKHS